MALAGTLGLPRSVWQSFKMEITLMEKYNPFFFVKNQMYSWKVVGSFVDAVNWTVNCAPLHWSGLVWREHYLVLLLPDDEGGGPVSAGDPAGQLQSGVSLHHQSGLTSIYLCYWVWTKHYYCSSHKIFLLNLQLSILKQPPSPDSLLSIELRICLDWL